MQIIKTGRQVTQAVKNVQRLRQIVGTFARHGLEDFLIRMGLEKYLPASPHAEEIDKLSVPERLRMACESLGPTFIKLGQLLGNRPDMIPEVFIEEFKKLQDNITPAPFEIIRTQVERELGGKLDELFQSFNPQPIATASIGQVHEAVLRTGEEVVVKVQRPDIEPLIRNDISTLSFLAGMMEKYLPETRAIGPRQVVDEFFRTLTFELDFIVEANNTARISENFKDYPRVVIPKVYRRHTTKRVLTLERLHGIKINNIEAVKAQGISTSELVDIGAKAFFKMVLQDGLFHGDLHGGNLFALKDRETGQSRIGVLDFGIVGRLSNKSRDIFSRMVLALLSEDYEALCYEYLELGAIETGVNFDSFQREVRNAISPYMGAALKDINLGALLIDSTKIAVRYNIKVPSDWMLVFKAIFTIEGLGKQLDPEFDFLSVGQELIKDVVKDRYSVQRMTKDLSWLMRDVNALVQTLPRQIRWMFRKFNANDFAIEIKFKESELVRAELERGFRGVGVATLSGALFIASAISLQMPTDQRLWGKYPLISVIFFILAAIGFLRFMFSKKP